MEVPFTETLPILRILEEHLVYVEKVKRFQTACIGLSTRRKLEKKRNGGTWKE